MAKLKNEVKGDNIPQIEEEQSPIQQQPTEGDQQPEEEQPIIDNTPSVDENIITEDKTIPTKEKKEDKNNQTNKSLPKVTKEVVEPHINRVLKAYSSYKTLYVDVHGGAFPPDTPQNIRGKAKLYTNPHFKTQ